MGEEDRQDYVFSFLQPKDRMHAIRFATLLLRILRLGLRSGNALRQVAVKTTVLADRPFRFIRTRCMLARLHAGLSSREQPDRIFASMDTACPDGSASSRGPSAPVAARLLSPCLTNPSTLYG